MEAVLSWSLVPPGRGDRGRRRLALAALVLLPLAGQAQDWNRPSLPYIGEEKKGEGTEEQPLYRLRFAFDYPLRTSAGGAVGAGTQGTPAVSPTGQVELRTFPHSYWFAAVTFYRYLQEERQRPWNPDFTYTFGYDDWHPNTLSLVYGNYSGNRLNPGPGEVRSHFNQGGWSLGYKFKLPEALEPIFKVHEKHEIGCSVNANLVRDYTDLRTLSIKHDKHTLSGTCRYSLPNNYYANLTAFYYPDRHQQQPWDPDFTYGFGYFDWHPGSISIQYNNYSGNRYIWREPSGSQGGFSRGSVSISWSVAF